MNTTMRWTMRVLLAAALLTLLQAVVGLALGAGARADVSMVALLPSNLAASLLMLWLAARSTLARGRLVAALFALHFGVGSLASMLEAVFFDIVPPLQGLVALAGSALIALGFAYAVVRLARAHGRADAGLVALAPGTRARWVARVAGCSLLYLVLYIIAGMIIYPFIRSFYETIGLPSFDRTVMLQLFVRGPMFVAAVMLLVAMTPGSRRRRALTAAVAMAVLGGVIPLLVPTPLFPDAVRWLHLAEVTSSNFLFGLITGRIVAGRTSREADAARPLTPAGLAVAAP